MSAVVLPHLLPCTKHSSVSCHQVSGKIKKEDWNRERNLIAFVVESAIPGVNKDNSLTSSVLIANNEIIFVTAWPKDVDLDLIHLHAEYVVRTNGGKCAVAIKGGQPERKVEVMNADLNCLSIRKRVIINTDLLCDEDWPFTVEADLRVEMKVRGADNSESKKISNFGEEIKSIFNEEASSDVKVIAGDKQFKCHKVILCARSEVFKNTLGPNTLESHTNTIVIKETPAQAVEDMLKYIYSGDIPENPDSLTSDLLHIANMHLLQPLVEACMKNIVDNLDVSSCISTFMLVDRYVPQDLGMREVVIRFMQCKATEVVEVEDWDKLVDSHPALAKELVRAIARATKEKHRCQFCLVSYK